MSLHVLTTFYRVQKLCCASGCLPLAHVSQNTCYLSDIRLSPITPGFSRSVSLPADCDQLSDLLNFLSASVSVAKASSKWNHRLHTNNFRILLSKLSYIGFFADERKTTSSSSQNFTFRISLEKLHSFNGDRS
jgi:hypothetical protein